MEAKLRATISRLCIARSRTLGQKINWQIDSCSLHELRQNTTETVGPSDGSLVKQNLVFSTVRCLSMVEVNKDLCPWRITVQTFRACTKCTNQAWSTSMTKNQPDFSIPFRYRPRMESTGAPTAHMSYSTSLIS